MSSRQRNKPKSHRLWGKHSVWQDGKHWIMLCQETQEQCSIEKKVRLAYPGFDEQHFKILPIGSIPSDLE